MKPHLYPSIVFPGHWCCTLAIKRQTPYQDRTGAERVLLPVVDCPVGRATTVGRAWDNMQHLLTLSRS